MDENNFNVESIQKPVLLIYDGHGSHLTYETITQAMEQHSIILCLPKNSSHAIQLLDAGVFSPLKRKWKDILKHWFHKSRLESMPRLFFLYC